jgi:hypothetical protein
MLLQLSTKREKELMRIDSRIMARVMKTEIRQVRSALCALKQEVKYNLACYGAHTTGIH